MAYAVPIGGAPVGYASTQIYVQNTVVAAKAPATGRGCGVASGFLQLLVTVLTSLGAYGPWWAWSFDSATFIWLCPWGVSACLNSESITGFSSFGGYCSVSSTLLEYVVVVGLAFTAQGPDGAAAALALPGVFTESVLSQMRAGTGLLAFASILSFISMITSFVAGCNGIKGCCGLTSNVLNALTALFALAGVAAAGAGFNTATIPQTLGTKPLVAGLDASKNWGPGFGLGCGVAGTVLAMLAFVLTCVGVCKKAA